MKYYTTEENDFFKAGREVKIITSVTTTNRFYFDYDSEEVFITLDVLNKWVKIGFVIIQYEHKDVIYVIDYSLKNDFPGRDRRPDNILKAYVAEYFHKKLVGDFIPPAPTFTPINEEKHLSREDGGRDKPPEFATGGSAKTKRLCRPWKMGELKDWSIAGMNHYRGQQDGDNFLYVMMNNDHGNAIKAEGLDNEALWIRLEAMAVKVRVDSPKQTPKNEL